MIFWLIFCLFKSILFDKCLRPPKVLFKRFIPEDHSKIYPKNPVFWPSIVRIWLIICYNFQLLARSIYKHSYLFLDEKYFRSEDGVRVCRTVIVIGHTWTTFHWSSDALWYGNLPRPTWSGYIWPIYKSKQTNHNQPWPWKLETELPLMNSK